MEGIEVAMPTTLIERRISWAGVLIAGGLVIQLLTLLWTHPLAFVAFLLLGCPLVVFGILLFLYALVSHEPSGSSPAGPCSPVECPSTVGRGK